MCELTLRNIGAINQTHLKLNKITVLLGPQSSGKSTISKILCHCQWVEKRCYVNFQEESKQFMDGRNFIDGIERYHRMEGYFGSDSYILYKGNYVTIEYKNLKVNVNRTETSEAYQFPKLCYIPAERNLVTAIPNLKKYNETNDLILYFMYDWFTSREYLKHLDLSKMIDRSIRYEYIKDRDADDIYDGERRLKLANASSGIQSILPLYAVAMYATDSIYKLYKPLSSEEKMQLEEFTLVTKALNEGLLHLEKEMRDEKSDSEAIKKRMDDFRDRVNSLSSQVDYMQNLSLSANRKFFYQRTDLYVEEPEQNLFPVAQSKLIYWLFSSLKNDNREHSLFLTTHSPYILFAINNCLIGGLVGDKLTGNENADMKSKEAWINPQLVNIYEIHNGDIRPIQDRDGLLLNNYLNNAYRQINNEYFTLLDYYED